MNNQIGFSVFCFAHIEPSGAIMKRTILLILALALVLPLVCAAAGSVAYLGNPMNGMSRAVVNIVSSPLEVPHAILQDVNHYSIVGLGTGPVKGSVYGVSRFLAGTADLLTIGILSDEYAPYHAFCLEPAFLQRDVCGPAPIPPRQARPVAPPVVTPDVPAPPRLPAILVEIVDLEDPLITGEETTYKISVQNQGTKEDRNVAVTVKFPKELNPLSADGSSPGTIKDTVVTFKPYAALASKETLTYTIKAKAAQVGDGRIKLSVKSDFLTTPVVEEESTHVY